VAESVWDVVRGVPACRLAEIPRRRISDDSDADGRDESRGQRLAALVSAYHGDEPVLIGWRRAQAAGPVEVYVGGRGLITEADAGAAVLSLPAGGRGRVLRPGAVADVMNDLPHWARIGGITDGLLTDDHADTAGQVMRPSLEDCLLSVWTQPFAWLLLAEPINAGETGRLADEIADRAYTAQSMAERSPEKAVQAQRLERRHRELRQAATSGLWRVHLLAGGTTPQAAERVAALVCASADLDGLPYALAPQQSPPAITGDGGAAWPFEAGSRLVAALARPPVREVPGVRFVVRPEFDVTPETTSGGAGSVPLGRVLDRNRVDVGVLSVPMESLNRHTFVCGATGAGKSQTVRGLLESATAAGLPWLVVEPAKAEYRLMAARLPDAEVVAIRPGDVDAIAAGINPLEPAKDADGRAFPLQTHADLVRALFLAAFESDEPFPQVLSAALTRCYEQLGWDLALGEPRTPGTTPRYPTLADLQAAAEQVVTEIGYGKEITDNVRGFIRVRLSSLRLGTTGRFFEGGHPIDFERLLARNVVFEIEDVGDDRDKAFLMGTVLVRLVEYLRMRQRAESGTTGLRHLSVFEEAHRLLRKSEETGPAAHAVEMFAGLLAEIRAYGEGLIVAEQIPSKLVPDVIKNTAVKIVHRLPAKDDRDAVGATMNITDAQSQFLVTLRPGEGAVFTDGMDYPHLVRMPDGTAAENTQPARLASPGVLVTSRSSTCGTDCHTSPCTLRDMRTAQRALADHPSLVLWAELSTAAHLSGWGSPVPGQPILDSLQAMPDRLRDCALSHAVDAAVDARASVIAARTDPGAFADHLVAVLHGRLNGGNLCTGEEPEWFTTPYRWCLVLEELRTIHNRTPDAGRHPGSSGWEHVYGRAVPGDGVADQLEHVSRWWDRDQRDHTARHAALWGTPTPSAIETAATARRDDDDWTQRLGEAVADLGNIDGLIRFYTSTD
jgi:DNA helicase HerA-like ATPase